MSVQNHKKFEWKKIMSKEFLWLYFLLEIFLIQFNIFYGISIQSSFSLLLLLLFLYSFKQALSHWKPS